MIKKMRVTIEKRSKEREGSMDSSSIPLGRMSLGRSPIAGEVAAAILLNTCIFMSKCKYLAFYCGRLLSCFVKAFTPQRKKDVIKAHDYFFIDSRLAQV
jgi:hypothetical protein